MKPGLHHDPVPVAGATGFIEFADTGSGIPEEIRKKIFDPFTTAGRQGPASASRFLRDHRGPPTAI